MNFRKGLELVFDLRLVCLAWDVVSDDPLRVSSHDSEMTHTTAPLALRHPRVSSSITTIW